MTFLLVNADGDLELEIRDTGWMGHGTCASAGQRTEDFFVEETSTGEATGTVLAAKRSCAVCPVRIVCLSWALTAERDEEYRSGIFGGLTGPERLIAQQATDPIAFGLRVLDEQVRVGLVSTRIERWREHGNVAERGSI